MALPLKSGADLYTQELLRARLHNYDGDLSEYGVGSIYYNTTSGLNTSDRIRYRGRNAWHSVANLDDIARLEELIAELGDVSGGNITDLLNRIIEAEGDIEAVEGRVKTIEDDYLTDDDKQALSALITTLQGYFSNGVANDAAKLGGQLPSYYAQSSVLGQLRTEFDALYKTLNDDTEGVINTWQEVVDFVNEYSGSEDLSTILAGMNTQIDNRYTKGEVDTKLSAYRLLTNGTFDVLVNANKGIETDEITIGGIKLSVVEGQLKIDGDAFATGQLASGGIGEAGSGSGASGIVILEDWSKYDESVAQVVGAVLGKDLHDRLGVAESTLESLVGKATNVSVVQTLTSGKEIGAITIDGVATKLYAPATYAWGEITSKPTTLSGYGITDVIGWRNGDNLALDIRENALFKHAGYGYSSQGWYANGPAISIGHSANYIMQLQMQNGTGDIWKRAVDAGSQKAWRKILDSGNYDTVLGTVYAPYNAAGYLPLSGGTMKLDSYSSLFFQRNGAGISAVGYSNSNGVLGYIGVAADANPIFMSASGTQSVLLHNGNYESIVSNKFLKLTGGTITTDSSWAFVIQRNSDSASYVCFNNINGTLGYLGVSADSTPRFMDANGVAQLLLHEGNFNTYAPTLTGTGASGTWDISVKHLALSNTAIENAGGTWDYLDGLLTKGGLTMNIVQGLPSGYFAGNDAIVLNFGLSVNYGQQWLLEDTSHKIMVRCKNRDATPNWSTWKTVAFTDSNVASATKLATPRTIWGQSFDGTADVSGNLKLNQDNFIQVVLNGISYNVMGVTTGGAFEIGKAAAQAMLGTTLSGYSLYLQYGTTPTMGFVLNSSGNVTIGNGDKAGTNYKLYVDAGKVRFASVAGAHPALGAMSDRAVTIGLEAYGMQSYVLGDGSAHIQVGRFDGTALAYSLFLNPLGGSVVIGASTWSSANYKLTVNGNSSFRHAILADRYNGQGNVAGCSIVINKGGDYFGVGPSASNLTNISFGLASNDSGTWKSELVSITDSGNVGVGTPAPSEKLHVVGNLYVTGDIIADGQVSSGGVAEEGTGGAVGGSGLERVVFTIPANTTTFDCVHNLGTREISVAIYEEGNDYQQILTDVYLDSTNIARVVFGSATDVAHKVVIIG